jgi:hypothetical protein
VVDAPRPRDAWNEETASGEFYCLESL